MKFLIVCILVLLAILLVSFFFAAVKALRSINLDSIIDDDDFSYDLKEHET